jgi:DNA-binding transcriptional regulator YiaG
VTPRCGRVMRRYEPARWGIAVTKDPVCGRLAGHRGRCLSEMCLSRAREYARQRDRRRAAEAQAAAGPSPGRRIREARHWAGMSQQAVARALGDVSQASISHWELDRFNPGEAVLARIAAATGAPVTWLLPGAEVSRAA